jgi:hypothetical protein
VTAHHNSNKIQTDKKTDRWTENRRKGRMVEDLTDDEKTDSPKVRQIGVLKDRQKERKEGPKEAS